MFDDEFSTAPSIAPDESPPSFWNELNLLSYVHKIPLDPESTVTLQNEWLTPDEMEERNRSQSRQQVLCHSSSLPSTQITPQIGPIPVTSTITTDPSLLSSLLTPEMPSSPATPAPVPIETPKSPVLSMSVTQEPRHSACLTPPRCSARNNKGMHETRLSTKPSYPPSATTQDPITIAV